MTSTPPPTRIVRTRQAPNIRWKDEDIQQIVQWLCFRDGDGVLTHLNTYQKSNKVEASRRLLEESGLGLQRPDISKEKTRDKIGQMIKTFKETRSLADTTGWGVDPTNHDVVADNTRGETIKEVILKKCAWYYEFEEIMGDLPTITPPFLIESTQPDVTTELMTGGKELNDDSEDDNFEIDLKDKTTDEDNQSETDLLKEGPMKKKTVKHLKPSTLNKKMGSSTKCPWNVDSDSETSRPKLSKQRSKNKSVGDAMIEVQLMKSKDFEIDQARLQRNNDLEIKQRDQHHQEIILKHEESIIMAKMQHEETMRRLQIELEKTSQR